MLSIHDIKRMEAQIEAKLERANRRKEHAHTTEGKRNFTRVTENLEKSLWLTRLELLARYEAKALRSASV